MILYPCKKRTPTARDKRSLAGGVSRKKKVKPRKWIPSIGLSKTDWIRTKLRASRL